MGDETGEQSKQCNELDTRVDKPATKITEMLHKIE